MGDWVRWAKKPVAGQPGIDWRTPGMAQAQMNELRRTDPAQAALVDRYLQARDDAQNTPSWRLPFAKAAGTTLATGYEAVKALPVVGGYDPLNGVAAVFGPQFKRGTPGTPDATSPASFGNVDAITRGYDDVMLERANDAVTDLQDSVVSGAKKAGKAVAQTFDSWDSAASHFFGKR